jgi:hypothetical protein
MNARIMRPFIEEQKVTKDKDVNANAKFLGL